MLFNSIEFTIFLPIVFVFYWFIVNKNLRLQNAFLLLVSYVFYGWWDWRFLSLIVFSSIVDYLVGLKLKRTDNEGTRKTLLFLSIGINIGFLAYFKYFNFFIESFSDAFTLFGRPFDVSRLNIVLPVGISFYTFQTLSYSVDVYRRRLEPTNDIIAFFAFVSFFPQLVAGPIERASNLLPQILKKRAFNYAQAVDGSRQILWGLFKKVVIADQCANHVNEIFANFSSHSGATLLVGAIFFSFQIYGDFSGYSDIAIGTAKLFGIRLMTNFSFPYFSRDIAEFWRRWHISLSTWFRDYVYIPLGGSKGSRLKKVRNVVIIFLVSGFWHGANWTFIVWGLLNALYFLPLLLLKINRNNTDAVAEGKLLPNAREFLQIILTFGLTLIAWVFFRAESVTQAVAYLDRMFFVNLFPHPGQFLQLFEVLLNTQVAYLIGVLLLVEWVQRERVHALEGIGMPKVVRRLSYLLLIFVIYYYYNFSAEQEFIYFQF